MNILPDIMMALFSVRYSLMHACKHPKLTNSLWWIFTKFLMVLKVEIYHKTSYRPVIMVEMVGVPCGDSDHNILSHSYAYNARLS